MKKNHHTTEQRIFETSINQIEHYRIALRQIKALKIEPSVHVYISLSSAFLSFSSFVLSLLSFCLFKSHCIYCLSKLKVM